MRPCRDHVTSRSPNYDSAGVSIEGAIPRAGHLGAIIYGETAAENAQDGERAQPVRDDRAHGRRMGRRRNERHRPQGTDGPPYLRAVVPRFPRHVQFRRAARSRQWPGTARTGFMRGSRVTCPTLRGAIRRRKRRCATSSLPTRTCRWARGCGPSAPRRYRDDDGWRVERGKVYARGGDLGLEFDMATATLLSPPDQVIRAATIESLILGLRIRGRSAPSRCSRALTGTPWTALGEPVAAVRFTYTSAGVQVPLVWPPTWRRNQTIAAELKIVMAFDAGVADARLERIALYPGANARAPSPRISAH